MDDASYKRLLGHERIVKDLLIGFIAPRRPAGWAETLDFDSLSEGPTESINDELRRRHDDVVWSIDRRAACGAVHTLHVVVYNGDARWDAPLTLAGLVKRTEHDGPAQLALSYDVVDLMAVGRKLGVILPSIREYEEANAVLANTIDRWEAEILQRGIEQGIEQEKALLRRLAERRFGAAAAEQLAAALAGVTDPDRLAEAGDWIVDSATTDDFLSRLGGAGS